MKYPTLIDCLTASNNSEEQFMAVVENECAYHRRALGDHPVYEHYMKFLRAYEVNIRVTENAGLADEHHPYIWTHWNPSFYITVIWECKAVTNSFIEIFHYDTEDVFEILWSDLMNIPLIDEEWLAYEQEVAE